MGRFPTIRQPGLVDELIAILRGHGVSPGTEAPAGEQLIAEVQAGRDHLGSRLCVGPPHWSQPMPDDVSRYPLTGEPLVRGTWAVSPANSRRLDIALFVDALQNEPADGTG